MRHPTAIGILGTYATTEQGFRQAPFESLGGFNLAGNHVQLVVYRRKDRGDFLLFRKRGMRLEFSEPVRG